MLIAEFTHRCVDDFLIANYYKLRALYRKQHVSVSETAFLSRLHYAVDLSSRVSLKKIAISINALITTSYPTDTIIIIIIGASETATARGRHLRHAMRVRGIIIGVVYYGICGRRVGTTTDGARCAHIAGPTIDVDRDGSQGVPLRLQAPVKMIVDRINYIFDFRNASRLNSRGRP